MNTLTPQEKAGLKLRQLLKENNMTQQALADSLYTDVKQVSRYVNNGINQISTLQRLAEFFKIDYRDFLAD